MMEEAIQQLQAKDTKERMAGVERLQTLLEHSRKGLSVTEVGNLVDATLVLLKDNNFRVCQGALQALASAAALAGEHLKVHLNALLPAVVERLGDSKQPVRDAGRRLLLALMEISSPTIIVERSGSCAWTHKNWRVREEFARTAASAINLFAATELPFQRSLLPSVLNLLEDSNSNVREAAMMCLEEMYREGGNLFKDELQRHSLRAAQLKEIAARFDKIVPKMRTFESLPPQLSIPETKHTTNMSTGGNRRSSPKAKPPVLELSTAGDVEANEKPVDPIRVCSERELSKEIEKIASMLTPEQDWSVRISAMQRVEGLVAGGAAEHACFPSSLKQLVGPLCLQLSDRRSSIVKQTCHLLNMLSRELLSDFEPLAESFLPALFKLVVITVLVIAESADNCIKTMLRNCRVSRLLPRIIDCAKNDRSAILRARCCEYALLVLEQWGDSPEMQRSADFYEDLIRCCVGDAMSEVRSMARSCYRLFAKIWPERSRRLFSAFDPVIQRLINEEDGGSHKRYTSPSVRERGHHLRNSAPAVAAHAVPHSTGGSTATQIDRNVNLTALDPSNAVSQKTPAGQFTDRNLENVLQASRQQVSAIETMLKGMDVIDKAVVSTTTRLIGKDPAGGSYRKIHAPLVAARVIVDPPSARDPPHPASAPASNHANMRAPVHMPSNFRGGLSGPPDASPFHSHSFAEPGRTGHLSGVNREGSGISVSNVAKRVPMTTERSSQTSSVAEPPDAKGPKRVLKTEVHPEKTVQENNIPGFQRPLMRSSISARSSVSSRSCMDEPQAPSAEPYSCLDGLMSLSDALTEGLSMNADWSARVAAFTYLRKLLQQGPRGLQDVNQNFEKVMKLFYEHLDDPHHKVAQAALSTLAELVPPCRKVFEAYLERILPRVFSRLIDAKEVIRQLGTSALEIVGKIYSIDSLLPALLRSLDEQRSPKAKMAVIEFAIAAFAKLALNGVAAGGSGLLKLWLAKLAPLANDKNPKVKETAVTGIVSVYSHFDSTTVLNFILGLSIEEQSILRRALKQYTPRIEVDLMTYLQNRNQRGRSKAMSDQGDGATPSEETCGGFQGKLVAKNQPVGSYASGSVRSSVQQEPESCCSRSGEFDSSKHVHLNYKTCSSSEDPLAGYANISKEVNYGSDTSPDRSRNALDQIRNGDSRNYQINSVGLVESHLKADPRMTSTSASQEIYKTQPGYEALYEEKSNHRKLVSKAPLQDSVPSRLLQKFLNWAEEPTNEKREALQEVIQQSPANDKAIWSQYSNQILTVVMETFDDPDPVLRELAMSVIPEMLSNQKGTIDVAVEVVLEKLLHASRDHSVKVSTVADRCLSAVLSQCDPHRCLTVVVPLLVSEDDKTLVTCISCLTKLVTRLPQEELMAQLPSFLPALFDAFGNQNADVRKTVVFCLVDIYIVLGKAFVPYLGSLSSTQLRLVTIYANRISQARTGAALDPIN